MATRNGVYSFGIHIPSFRVKMERFHMVNQCLRCYEYTHSTSRCTQRIQQCSLCSADHHYSICKCETLCCLLCTGDHPAISIRCPHRQDVIKNMEKSTSSTGASTSEAASQSPTTSTSGFNAQAAIFPELPGGRPTATTSQWGASSQTPTCDSSSQPSSPAHTDQPLNSTVQLLTSAASMIACNNPQEYVRILNILYKANGLPAFIVPEEVFTNTTSSSQDTVLVPDITVNAAVLTDLLSTAKPAPPATSSQATQTPTPPLSTTATVPSLVCEPSQRQKSAATPIKPQQARTQPPRFTASTPDSADSSDEDVSVGTPPPPLKQPNTTEDFRLEATSNDSLTVSTRSKTNKQARRPGKKKNTDDLRPSTSRNQ
ncbi:uncharacterized protein [Procambarus clarkii]|uniref:uncharacterized protein n=1 Tax=Procambarus clarkii TaxID=6728 RepID=UPI0037438EDA